MTATIARHGPDQIIALPSLRRPAEDRWVVLLWREGRARFTHYRAGATACDHFASWVGGQWSSPLPEAIPAQLGARAHRQLKQLQRTAVDHPATTPAQRLAAIRSKRSRRPVRLFRP